jgi:hypothetical protein
MPEQKPASGPRRPDEIELAFIETLRQAAWIFEHEQDGRFRGSILACRAVARFIHQSDGGAELASPFLHIAAAFTHLERGGRPRLFSKKTAPARERDRSPERKHMQRLAAVALDVLVELGDPLAQAAATVARHVNSWPTMAAQQVAGATVVAWRKQQRQSKSKEFEIIVRQTLEEPDPRATIQNLLQTGPPGQFR